jgi:hypothetical protein
MSYEDSRNARITASTNKQVNLLNTLNEIKRNIIKEKKEEKLKKKQNKIYKQIY